MSARRPSPAPCGSTIVPVIAIASVASVSTPSQRSRSRYDSPSSRHELDAAGRHAARKRPATIRRDLAARGDRPRRSSRQRSGGGSDTRRPGSARARSTNSSSRSSTASSAPPARSRARSRRSPLRGDRAALDALGGRIAARTSARAPDTFMRACAVLARAHHCTERLPRHRRQIAGLRPRRARPGQRRDRPSVARTAAAAAGRLLRQLEPAGLGKRERARPSSPAAQPAAAPPPRCGAAGGSGSPGC